MLPSRWKSRSICFWDCGLITCESFRFLIVISFFFFFFPPSTVFWLGLNAFDFNLECNHILYCFSRIRYGISLYKQANKNPVTFPFFPNLCVSTSLSNMHLKLVGKDVYINDCYPPKALFPLLSLSIVAIICPDFRWVKWIYLHMPISAVYWKCGEDVAFLLV